MADFDITIDGSEVLANFEALSAKVKAGAQTVGNATGQMMASYAKLNARWTDRTGLARSGLSYSCTWEGDTLDIAVYHTMDYGLWLEVRTFSHAGRLAILEDARDSQINAFTNAIGNLFK